MSPEDRAVLGRDDWIHAARPNQQLGGEPAYRWRYPDLEDLLARPDGARPDFRAALDDTDPVVATNAAISLARLGDASGMEPLARAVRTPEMKLPIRLAAAEALGTLGRPSAVRLLGELVDQYGHAKRDGLSHPVPQLHAELIRGLARHVDPADDGRFLQALSSPAADVRWETLQAWTKGRGGTLPAEAADLRSDPDPRVRAAALGCLARRRAPEAFPYLAAALDDHDFRVRVAAAAALGELGGADAQARLRQLLEDPAELIRAAAVSALAASGVDPAATGAAADKSWRVRLEAARALASYPTREGAALAGDLIDDPCPTVQHQVVASLGEWPLRQAGPVLLAGMGSGGYMTRKAAAGQLAARWPPAAEFPIEGPPQRRAEVLGRLERRFRHQIGLIDPEVLAAAAAGESTPPISPQEVAQVEQLVRNVADPRLPEPVRERSIASLVDFGPGVVQILEQLALDRCQMLPEAVYRQVLPHHAPAFAVLNRLASADVSIRRRAAEELADVTNARPLGRLAAARLASLVLTETDTLVWQRVLTAVALDPSEPAARLAYAAISHPAPDVRRRACEHLAAHPEADGRHVKVLLPALEDEDFSVVLAAVRALGVSGPVADTQPLRRLLLSSSESLRVEVAIALARLGDAAGPAALERLSYSNDQTVRRRVAVAMGEIGDASFTPSLVRLLDDHHGIRLAALESLPKVVGHDVAETEQPPPASLGERLDCWKRWFGRQHGTVALRPSGKAATDPVDRPSSGPR